MRFPVFAFLICGLSALPARADLAGGIKAFEVGNYATAIAPLKPLADKGSAEAAFELGLINRDLYLKKPNAEKNATAAQNWLMKAARLGDPAMKREVAKVFEKYKHLRPTLYEDIDLLGEAARGGDAEAIYLFALSFEYGHDLRKYKFGIGLDADAKKAEAYYLKAAEKGYAPAESALAAMYHFGNGVERDDKKALEWAKKAALQGNVRAYSLLGGIYYTVGGTEQDHIEAMKWFLLAELYGNPAGKPLRRIAQFWFTKEMLTKAIGRAKDIDLGVEGLVALSETEDKYCKGVNMPTTSPETTLKMIRKKYSNSSEETIVAEFWQMYFHGLWEFRRSMDSAYERGDHGKVKEISDLMVVVSCNMLNKLNKLKSRTEGVD